MMEHPTSIETKSDAFKPGQLLVAMPGMEDPRFARAVIYMCAHGPEGAMGLVVNKAFDQMKLPDLLEQLGIEPAGVDRNALIHFGGPVETGRGFILHSADYLQDSTMIVAGDVALTATVDILRAIAEGKGPRQRLMALGYAGWGPGQLEDEVKENGWLLVDPDESILFDGDLSSKWKRAIGKLGIDPFKLSTEYGSA